MTSRRPPSSKSARLAKPWLTGPLVQGSPPMVSRAASTRSLLLICRMRTTPRGPSKFKLVCEEVQGKNCLTNFHGMGLTTDKLRSMVKKWQTLIEANCDVKTTDGYTLRVFCIGFTRKQELSTKKTAYAQAGQVRNIRKKMIDIISREVTTTDLKDVVNKQIPDSIVRDIEKACQGIYPLHDVHIRKVKVIRRPRFDLNKLMDMHGEGSDKAAVSTDPNTGEVVERPEGYEPPVMDAV